MSDPKIFDNPMFEKDSKSLHSVEFKSAEGQGLIGLDTNPIKNFAQEYARRFYALKIVNAVLLFFTAILSTVGALYFLKISRWSSWHWKTPLPRTSDGGIVESESLAILAWIMFFLATFSLLMYRHKKKTVENSKMFLCGLAVTDICLSLFNVLNLLFFFVSFALRTTSEYLWFYPRLMDGTSLQNLTEFKLESGYHYKPYHRRYYESDEVTTTTTPASTTFSPYHVWEMESRKREIIVRLFLDPTVVIFVLLAIFVNIVSVFRIRKAIKQTNLWASNYTKMHPEASQVSASYAHWLNLAVKTFIWVIPVFLILAPIYRITYRYDPTPYYISMTVCFAVCFYRWILYIQKVRFRSGDLPLDSMEQEKTISKEYKLDFVVYCIGALYYSVLFSYLIWDASSRISMYVMLLFLACAGHSLYLLYKNGEMSKFSLKLPKISINVTINVTKEPETGAEEESVKKESGDQEKKEDQEEKKKEKNFCENV